MSKHTQAVLDDMDALADDARALISATNNVAEETVVAARHRLQAALDRGKDLCGRARDQAVSGMKATDQAVREHPYQLIGVAVGAGLLLGYLLSSRRSGRHE